MCPGIIENSEIKFFINDTEIEISEINFLEKPDLKIYDPHIKPFEFDLFLELTRKQKFKIFLHKLIERI